MSREHRVILAVFLLAVLGLAAFEFEWSRAAATALILAGTIAAGYYLTIVRPARLPAGGLLELRLAGDLREFSMAPLIDRILGRNFPTLFHVRRALEGAAENQTLGGVMVEICGLEIGMAVAEELHGLLRDVKKSGKRVVAVIAGDGCTPAQYLAACGAGEVVCNPDTSMMMLGVAAGNMFIRQALEKLEIQAQTLQWKEYKGAAEMFSRDNMSPALRESVAAIVAQRQRSMEEAVAESRRLEPARARELLKGGFLSARQALEAGLVDRLGYAEELRDQFDPEHRRRKIISLVRMLRHVDYNESRRRRPRIALVYGVGPVVTGDGLRAGEMLRADETAAEIEAAARDSRVRAIVFRVNSPGGSAVASDLVWRAVCEARRRGKPVVASMGDVAGSGGYYVSMGADAIVAEPSTITGSIGVVYMKLSFRQLLARLGISFDLVKSGEVSDALSMARPMTEAELKQLDSVMGELYETFTGKVAEARRLGREEAEKLARGRIWSGRDALAGGLIDALGGMGRAVEIAKAKAGMRLDEPHEIALYTSAGGWLPFNVSLVSAARVPIIAGELAAAVGIPRAWAPAMLQLLLRGGAALLSPIFL